MRLIPITKTTLKALLNIYIYPVQTTTVRQCRMRYLIITKEYSCIAECSKTCELKENCVYANNIGYLI